jgi:hypothetical protein
MGSRPVAGRPRFLFWSTFFGVDLPMELMSTINPS